MDGCTGNDEHYAVTKETALKSTGAVRRIRTIVTARMKLAVGCGSGHRTTQDYLLLSLGTKTGIEIGNTEWF